MMMVEEETVIHVHHPRFTAALRAKRAICSMLQLGVEHVET